MTEHAQEEKSEFMLSWGLILLTLGFAYSYLKLKSARKRKAWADNSRTDIDRKKIIIAIEIKDLVVKYSKRMELGYLPLNLQSKQNILTRAVRQFLKLGDYYRPMFSIQKIKQFMSGLSCIPKVELILYSSLQRRVTDAILTKLQIDRFFPQSHRKYCDLDNDDDQKHAIQVDRDSRRVLIITSNFNDHSREDEKYFLVMRPRTDDINYLKESLKKIKRFVEKNTDLNCLHDELAEFKINCMESDWSDYD